MSRADDIRAKVAVARPERVRQARRDVALRWAADLADARLDVARLHAEAVSRDNHIRALERALAELETALHDARTRIAACEGEVAALRESDTLDVPPVDPPGEDAPQS